MSREDEVQAFGALVRCNAGTRMKWHFVLSRMGGPRDHCRKAHGETTATAAFNKRNTNFLDMQRQQCYVRKRGLLPEHGPVHGPIPRFTLAMVMMSPPWDRLRRN